MPSPSLRVVPAPVRRADLAALASERTSSADWRGVSFPAGPDILIPRPVVSHVLCAIQTVLAEAELVALSEVNRPPHGVGKRIQSQCSSTIITWNSPFSMRRSVLLQKWNPRSPLHYGYSLVARSAAQLPTLTGARRSARNYATPTGRLQANDSPTKSPPAQKSASQSASRPDAPPADWDENPNLSISAFSELPSADFGVNQHMIINNEFKEALRQILWKFKAPIRYAFAYGSGVFPQSDKGAPATPASQPHQRPNTAISTVQGPEGKMIDFIFGVSYTQHWHWLNLGEHRDHYSGLGSLGSYAVSHVQDAYGAGVYFNPFVTVNGTLIKYGVVNLDTLCGDLAEWRSLYLAGRLHKPVKILRDDPRVRLANQVNLLSAVRAALLLLPETFTERDLYATIAGISYTGDPRMAYGSENPQKVANIVQHQLPNFRQLYAPLIETLPNVSFADPACSKRGWAQDASINAQLQQDMDPRPRGNMVRRLPRAFRQRLYFAFQARYQIPRAEFDEMLAASTDEDAQEIKRRQGGSFERRVAAETTEVLRGELRGVMEKTVKWPSSVESVKGFFTAGVGRSWRYMQEKRAKNKAGRQKVDKEPAKAPKEGASEGGEKREQGIPDDGAKGGK